MRNVKLRTMGLALAVLCLLSLLVPLAAAQGPALSLKGEVKEDFTAPENDDPVVGLTGGGGSWEVMEPLPEGRVFSAVAADANGYVYVMGGTSDAVALDQTNTNFRYNTATDTWDVLAPLPAAVYMADGAVIGNKVYIPGNESSAVTFVYDIAADSWDQIQANGGYGPRSQYRAVAVGNHLYVLGGIEDGSATNEVWVLDTLSKTWSPGPSMQHPRISFAAGVIDSSIYVAGGVNFPGFAPEVTAEVFDGTSWAYIPGIPLGENLYSRWSYMAGTAAAGRLWLAGGRRDFDWEVMDHSGYYDLAQDEWVTSPHVPSLNQGRAYLSGAVASDRYFYTFGGRDPVGSIIYDTNERLWVGGPEPAVSRIWGADRYRTSAAVSASIFPSSQTVVIARGDDAGDFADALAASVLAGVLECPILLTRPNSLPQAIADEILRLGASKAYVLGGTGAVSAGVEDALESLGLTVQRVSGPNRYATAAAVAAYASTLGDLGDAAFIVNGTATADALVSGAFAYSGNLPVLLVRSHQIPQITLDTLNELGIDHVTIVGGTGVVEQSVANTLNYWVSTVDRLGGANRFETSTLFAQAMYPGEENMTLVGGADANLVDGISAAALGLPIMYVRPTSLPATVTSHLQQTLTGFSRVYALGGPGAVDDTVLEQVEDMIQSIPPMVSRAYIEDESQGLVVHAAIDNTLDTISLELPSGAQFTDGYTNLSKPVLVTVADTEGGMYDIPAPGIRVEPGDDYIGLILMLFEDHGTPGAGTDKLLANDGTKVTLTSVDDPGNVRTYTLNISLSP